MSKIKPLCIGMEYELESTSPRFVTAGWDVERDGTLRGIDGYEFLFEGKQPLAKAVQMVESLLASIGTNYRASHRCSTHIHVDFTNLKGAQRIAMVLGLIAYDDYFFQFQPDRKKNSFCCPVLHSPLSLSCIEEVCASIRNDSRNLANSLGVRWPVPGWGEDHRPDWKYRSVNTRPLFSIGTVELRHFSPLMRLDDVKEITTLLNNLYLAALEVDIDDTDKLFEEWRYNKTFKGNETNIDWALSSLSTYNQVER